VPLSYKQKSLRRLARRHGVNPKTIAMWSMWRKRASVADRRWKETAPRRKEFKSYPVAIGPTLKFSFAEVHKNATQRVGLTS
jgi:hypothetical protein